MKTFWSSCPHETVFSPKEGDLKLSQAVCQISTVSFRIRLASAPFPPFQPEKSNINIIPPHEFLLFRTSVLYFAYNADYLMCCFRSITIFGFETDIRNLHYYSGDKVNFCSKFQFSSLAVRKNGGIIFYL